MGVVNLVSRDHALEGYAHAQLFGDSATTADSKFLLRVVCDVDKAEISLADTCIIVQSYLEELGTDILEQG